MNKPKKIACIGTHSVGKSTLCYQLAERGKRAGENVHVIQERVRFSPFPINSSMVPETALWASCNQVSKELEAQQKGFSLIICDRSAFDPFIYAAYYKLEDWKLTEFATASSRWLNTYDKIYFVRPRLNHVAKEDGVRSTDRDFIYGVDSLFAEVMESSGIEVQTIYTDEIFK